MIKILTWITLLSTLALGQETKLPLSLDTAINVQATDPQYAIELYAEVVEQSTLESDRSLAAFNRGVLLLESDEPNLAQESFRVAARSAGTVIQRRDALFNLGHAIMNGIDMSDQMQMDPEKIGEMIDQLRGAEHAFLKAARVDSSYIASGKNLQRVRMQIQDLLNMKEQIEQQQSQEQESQNEQSEDQDGQQGEGQGQDDEQKDMAKELQDLADQQREQAQDSEAASENEPQGDQQQRSDDQEQLHEQTEQAQDALENAQEAKDQQETLQDLQEAMKSQQEAQDALDEGDTEKAAQKQQKAADALDRAAQRMRESQESPEDQEGGQGQSGQPQDQPEAEDEPEIDEIAQKLLDKERDERQRRQAYRATGRPVKVEKDW